MAMSYLTESEAPRDFRVSSTESDGHYTKCILCYTVKKNFYCTECVKNGNFIHSSMPYSDRYSEKQVKLIRMKLNRQHVLERCEMLLAPKIKKDTLVTEIKQSRDKLELIRLAIEQRRSIINLKKKELLDLKNYNNELKSKLPRYQKRVSSLGKHAQSQRIVLQNNISLYNDQEQSLAALRRSRIRQLTRYIFPIYMSYDSSDSIEDMEFVGSDVEEEPPKRPQLHIVAPWIDIDADYSHMQTWAVSQSKEAGGPCPWAGAAARRARAALGLAAQLVALLAWTLDVRLPHALALGEYGDPRGWRACVSRARAGAAALCARAALPPPPAGPLPGAPPGPPAAPAPLAALGALHALALAAAGDDPELGRCSAALRERLRPTDSTEPVNNVLCPEQGPPREPVGGGRGVAGGGRARRARRPGAARAPALARRRAGSAALPSPRALAGDVSRRLARLHRLRVARLDQVAAASTSTTRDLLHWLFHTSISKFLAYEIFLLLFSLKNIYD